MSEDPTDTGAKSHLESSAEKLAVSTMIGSVHSMHSAAHHAETIILCTTQTICGLLMKCSTADELAALIKTLREATAPK